MYWKKMALIALMAMVSRCADDVDPQDKQVMSAEPVMQTVEQALWSACWSASVDCKNDVKQYKDDHPCADLVSSPWCSSGKCKISVQIDLTCENGGGECSSDAQCSWMSVPTGYKAICQNYGCAQKWIGYSGSCNDYDSCTYNDKYASNGSTCVGTPVNCGSGKYCSNGSCKYSSGGGCDDGDPCTINDAYDSWGSCKGAAKCASGYSCQWGQCTWNSQPPPSTGSNKCVNLYLQNLGMSFAYMTVGGIGCTKYVTNWDGTIDFSNSNCGSWNDSIRTEPMSSMGYAGTMTLKAGSGVKYLIHVIKLDGTHYVNSSSGSTYWWKGSLFYQTTGGSNLSYWYVKGSGGGGLVVTDLSSMSGNCN